MKRTSWVALMILTAVPALEAQDRPMTRAERERQQTIARRDRIRAQRTVQMRASRARAQAIQDEQLRMLAARRRAEAMRRATTVPADPDPIRTAQARAAAEAMRRLAPAGGVWGRNADGSYSKTEYYGDGTFVNIDPNGRRSIGGKVYVNPNR